MKKTYLIVLVVILSFVLGGCKKEDRILKKLVGTWNITEYKRAGGFVRSDFSSDPITIEFLPHKRAYTSTLKAIYRIDYTDPLKTDMIDTFKFELKKSEFNVSFVQKGTNSGFLKKRFKLEEYKNNKLKLSRIDSTDLYIKATK
jgi:hypothetical protein